MNKLINSNFYLFYQDSTESKSFEKIFLGNNITKQGTRLSVKIHGL